MARSIQTTVTILGRDELSPVVRSATNKADSELRKLNRRASDIASGAFGVSKSGAVMGTALAAPLIYAGKEAVEFEAKMTGLGKVANIELGSKALTQLGDQAKEAAYHLARMPTEVAASMKALKQSGIAVNQLKDIAIFTGEAGVAFDTTADQAGEAFGSIRAAMGLTLTETKDTFDVINELSNNMKATPEKLISFFTAGGAGVASALSIPAQEIAAFGATLIHAGKSGEEAATLMERTAKNIRAKKPLNLIYEKAGGGTAGILKVLEIGNKMGKKKGVFFQQFGEYSLEIENLAAKMTGPTGLLQAIDRVSSKEKYAGAVHKEFTSVQKSTLEQTRKAWVGFKIAVIDFGTAALPMIKTVVSDAQVLLKGIGGWIKANPELAATTFKATVALAGFSFAVSGVAAVVGAVAKSVAAVTTVIGWFSAGGALAGVTTGVTAFGAALWTAAGAATVLGAPLWLVVGAAAAVGLAFYKAYNHVEGFHKLIVSLSVAIQALASHAGPAFSKLFKGDFKGAYNEMRAANQETIINTAAEMENFRRDKPAPKALPTLNKHWLEDIKNSRAEKERRAIETMRDPLNIPGRGFTKPNMPAPKPIPGVSSGSSISITNNPIFNVSGDMTPEKRKDLLEIARESNYDLVKQLEQVKRNKTRTAL